MGTIKALKLTTLSKERNCILLHICTQTIFVCHCSFVVLLLFCEAVANIYTVNSVNSDCCYAPLKYVIGCIKAALNG